jgi:uncharacterized membrane protein
MNSNRLYFIDIIRAFAIIMMLQGHFISTLLADSYKDLNFIPYSVWSYFRGITAPTFFTISGLIFTYLLLKAKEKGTEKLRMRKGIIRGFSLIGIGYLLRIPFLAWFSGSFNTYFLVIDVLQCIGLSLLVIILLYFLCAKRIFLFSVVVFVLGIVIFLSEPLYRTLSIDALPMFFNNYISKSNGSVFTMIPWFGYVAFGAYLSTLFHRYAQKFEKYLKFPLLLRIGQKTLSIYVIHFTIIYGSFIGIGLNSVIGKVLTPWKAVFGAVLFITIVCFISFYYVQTNAYIYAKLRSLLKKRT